MIFGGNTRAVLLFPDDFRAEEQDVYRLGLSEDPKGLFHLDLSVRQERQEYRDDLRYPGEQRFRNGGYPEERLRQAGNRCDHDERGRASERE